MDEQSRKLIEELFGKEDYNEILKLTDTLLSRDSQEEDLHLYKALCLKAMKNYEESLKSFDQSIFLNPHNGITFYSKGNLHYENEKWSLAVQCYNQAIDINAKVNFYSKENPNFLIKEYENAIKHYENALKNAGSIPTQITKRKSSIETYEKLKAEHVFDK